jgi:DNA-binding winged helix-turn-helix (wHTH) protein
MEAPFRVSSKRSLRAANHKRSSLFSLAIERGDPNRQINARDDLRANGLLNAREVTMGVSGSTTVFEGVLSPVTAARTQFDPEPRLGVRRAVQSPDFSKPFFERRTEPASAASNEVSFGPFRLLPTQFLLLEGDKPVPLGSRALEILIVLLERPGELVSRQELMDRVWPNIFVEPANLSVHISALRRTLRDGRDGNRFIINIPGRGYSFVASVAVVGPLESDGGENRAALRGQA